MYIIIGTQQDRSYSSFTSIFISGPLELLVTIFAHAVVGSTVVPMCQVVG